MWVVVVEEPPKDRAPHDGSGVLMACIKDCVTGRNQGVKGLAKRAFTNFHDFPPKSRMRRAHERAMAGHAIDCLARAEWLANR